MNRMLPYSFVTHLQLELFRSITVSQGIPVLAKMSRGIKSSSEYQNIEGHRKHGSAGKDHHSSTGGQNSPQKLGDVSEEQKEYLFNPANEHEFPPLSASPSSKSKRRNQKVRGTELEENLDQGGKQTSSPQSNNALLGSHSNSRPHKSPFPSVSKKQVFAEQTSPRSSSYHDESSYPTTGFQEGQSHSASGRVNPEKKGPQGRATPENQGDTMCRHFDICFYSRKQLVIQKPSFPIKEQCSGRPYPEKNGPQGTTTPKNQGDTICRPFDICFRTRKQPVIQRPSCSQMDSSSVIENGEILRPGMVLLKSYIPIWQQVEIIFRCRELGIGPGGFYRPGYEDGAKLRLQMMCLGQDWDPQTRKYGSIREHDDSKPPDIPLDFVNLVKQALGDAHTLIKEQTRRSDVEKILPFMSPDICIVNFYTTNGRLGLHQDRDESRDSINRGLPVVSFSIGDSAEFLYGDERDIDKAENVKLESGDVLIFGGESRRVFHGVTSIIPKTTPKDLLEYTKLRPGRLNLTFRQY